MATKTMVSFNRRIVRILEEGAHCDAEVLNEANAVAATGEKSVTEFLLDKGVFDEATLLGLLAERLAVPPVDLARVELDKSLAETVPVG